MGGLRIVSGAADSPSQSSEKPSGTSILEIDSWMPSQIQAISAWVDRLMLLIAESHCIPGEEADVELALREALGNAVLHGNLEDPERKVHIRCRCVPGKEISIVVTDQGKGFDFAKTRDELTSNPTHERGHGIQLMEAYMDEVHFERGGSEVHMRKRPRTTSRA
jgi:serine/threonine-protein kinase RsbW